MTDARPLEAVDLFQALSPTARDRVEASGAQRTLRRGEVAFRQDDPAEELFVVLAGRVAIANRSPDNRESLVALMEPGDVFGELSLFDGRGRSAEARALETSSVLAIPYAALREALEAEPAALWSILGLLACRLRATDEALADAVFLDVPGRTAKRLLELAGDVDEFHLPVTQEELAGMVGASRERVNKAISTFIRLGWITQSERRYRVTDRPQLERRAR